MKIKLLMITLCLTLFFLTACQSQNASTADRYWKSARKADNLKSYVEKQADSLDVAVLQQEASSADSTLSQQFHATSLLCEMERQGGADAASYAESFLARVNNEGEQFWAALETSFSPYDCFYALLEAANQVDGNTLANLVSGIPVDSPYDYQLREAVGNWVKVHSGSLLNYVDDLKAAGYFNEWDSGRWKSTFFYDSENPYCIETDTIEDAIAYINYMHDTLLPELEAKNGEKAFKAESDLILGQYYSTNLAITVNETLELKEPDKDNLQETIDLDGKKILAFYRNPQIAEFKGSPTQLRVLGDFMLGLSKEEYPKTLNEADYYLVLTPSYAFNESETGLVDKRIVNSTTSVDLYEAGTGTFLKNLGYVPEKPLSDKSSDYSYDNPGYPELTRADLLYFMYHNANTPDEYASMVVNCHGKEEFQLEEPVTLGGWEITCHTCEVLDDFVEGDYIYTPDPGNQFGRLKLTVTNAGSEKSTFLPMWYYIGKDTLVQITDSSFEDYYDCVNVLDLDTCLVDTSIESGESAEGELIFQLPDEFVEAADTLYLSISLGEQNAVFCPIKDTIENPIDDSTEESIEE